MHAIIDSIRKTLVPIRREGTPFIAAFAVASLILGWLWPPLLWAGLLLTLWCIYFFRDPPRVSPIDPDLVLSPADGVIASVALANPPAELQMEEGLRTRISVFMSVFDCHVNRMPVAGTIERVAYRPGKFVNADLDKASEDNERNGLAIATSHGTIGVVQIAGLVARRILCWAKVGEELAAGQRFGMIRFGSRLDVYLPLGAYQVLVAEGQTAIAGETVLARYGNGSEHRPVRID